jgi:TolB-like protein
LSLWSEIKQRRITQIVVTYLAGGWIVTSVVDQVVDREVLPLVVYEVTLTLFLFGILAALIIGWYHGEKGAQEAPPIEIGMLVVIGVLALGASGQVVRSAMAEASLRDSLADAGLDLRRIGVLYFEDASSDGSAQAVAEAITEGLINTLAEVDELEVTSRNAARAVQGLDVGADSIASILDVGTVVRGTVDQVGGEVRVSVQLLEGQDGIQLSRESYSWPSEDVALVGSELAAEVAGALREQLGVEVRLRESQAAAPNSAAWLEVARAERSIKAADEALAEGDAEAYFGAWDAADEALRQAQEAAPEWVEPVVLRAQVAYGPWRYLDGQEQLQALDRVVELANEALEIEPDNAAALEQRGTARYARWLLEVDDEDELDALLTSARADLERALRLDGDRASVNSTLSHLYYQVDEPFEAVVAARTAYAQDAFLSVADDILYRLFEASYDLNDHGEAVEWCLEGRNRFPESFRFVQCQIVAMTMEQAEPDVAEAWALFDQMSSMMPEGEARSELLRNIVQTFVGAVIGRAGLPDSADAVLRRARMSSDLDAADEQVSMEAAMRSVMGDVDGSIERLERFMLANPGHFPGEHWWWRNAAADPRFERLRAVR